MSFRWKTALLVVGMTLVTMGGAFSAVWYYFVASQRQQLDSALLAVATREAAEAAAGQLSFSDAPGPSANAVGPLPKYGVIYSREGVPLTTTENFATAPSMPRLVSFDRCFDLEHESLHLRAVLVGVPQSSMRVLLASPRDDIEDDSRILAWAMAVAFGVGCTWAGLVSFFAATRLTRNYRAVERVARRVAAGETTARVTFASPDSALTQLAADLNSMIDRLVGLAAAQDRFVAHAAHELRTPLTALRIELEHALASGEDAAGYERAVRGALDSGKRLSALAEDLLDVARARAKPHDARDAVDLQSCVNDAVAELESLSCARGVSIRITRRAKVQVVGERRGLIRILRNLLENAVRFAPAESEVEVEATHGEGFAEVRVLDRGPGVPEADRERIFEAFERLARDDHHDGAGLGLSIARNLARSFGGDVTLPAGNSDCGASFVVRLKTPSTPEPEEAVAAIGAAVRQSWS